MKSITEKFFKWRKTTNVTDEFIASQFGHSNPRTFLNWQKVGIPRGKHGTAIQIMEDDTLKEDSVSHIRVPFTDEQLERTHRAASLVASDFQEYCQNAIAAQVNQSLKSKIWEFPTDAKAAEPEAEYKAPAKKTAHILAAAGSPIYSEVIDWDGEDDIVSIRICGDSMEPLFQDGDVIDFRHKRASRSEFMKKGVIYLVQYGGGWLVKRYNTRKPRKGEHNSEYLTPSGNVPILESLNPEYPEIIINDSLVWDAWYEGGEDK